MPVLLYGSEAMICKEKERSRIRIGQVDNLRRGLLSIRRINRVPNARVREFCSVAKGMDERIKETVLRWVSHIERM